MRTVWGLCVCCCCWWCLCWRGSPNTPLFFGVWALEECSTPSLFSHNNSIQNRTTAAAVCPSGNTCCPIATDDDKKNTTLFGCIPSDLGALRGTCCNDTTTPSGCGKGYRCASRGNGDNDSENDWRYYCQASETVTDPLVQQLPRYRLCTVPSSLLETVYGFPVHNNNNQGRSRLAYYSSHGDLTKINDDDKNNDSPKEEEDANRFSKVRVVVLAIHGANRNADDYFCSMIVAAQQWENAPKQQQQQDTATRTSGESPLRSVLVVAPWFAQVGDIGKEGRRSGQETDDATVLLQWSNQSKDGTWRYGANAVAPPSSTNVSSFDALNALVQFFLHHNRFPNLERLVVAGHSSGGQMVQRWTLLTSLSSSPSLSTTRAGKPRHIHLHSVVANPSSYAYLTPKRWIHGQWQIPSTGNSSCVGYNQWEWGLDVPASNSTWDVPYLKRALQQWGKDSLIQQFAQRSTSYLIGSQDRCNVSSSSSKSKKKKPWCHSHGLETTCQDELQGSTRWERHQRYYQSLLLRLRQHETTNVSSSSFAQHHVSVTVPGVGHDHSLMFASSQGQYELFERLPNDIETLRTTEFS